MPTVRVRPGFVHGFGDRYPAGAVFEATAAEALAFADKLEVMAETPLLPAASALDPAPVSEAALTPAAAEVLPGLETAPAPAAGKRKPRGEGGDA